MAELKLTDELKSQGSTSYKSAMEALRQTEYKLPEYDSSYDEDIAQLYKKIVNRESFRYDPMSDSLYGSYREQYSRQGRLAMMDSMAQASALTGGYGSSYAQSVGQQEYDSYLQKLGEVLPELYEGAYERYKAEGQQMQEEYQRMLDMEQQDYERYRDDVKDVQYQQGMVQKQDQNDWDRQQDMFDRLEGLILQAGYTPTDEELSQSGMTRAQADQLKSSRVVRSSGGSSRGQTFYYTKKSSNSGKSSNSSNSSSEGSASASGRRPMTAEEKLLPNAGGAYDARYNYNRDRIT